MKRLFLAGLAAWPVIAGAAHAATPLSIGLNLSINCPSGRPMSIPSVIRPAIYGVVIRFPSKAEAQQQLLYKEASTGEMIDPAYANNQRVILQWRAGPNKLMRGFATVPAGWAVQIGEEVAFIPSHGDPDNLCLYVPNLIEP